MSALLKILSTVLPAAMAFLLMAQVDAYGEPLFLDFKGIAIVITVLWLVFLWNVIERILDVINLTSKP